jgi:FKBP-type peptidyl-prolyl cis-trans isomerase
LIHGEGKLPTSRKRQDDAKKAKGYVPKGVTSSGSGDTGKRQPSGTVILIVTALVAAITAGYYVYQRRDHSTRTPSGLRYTDQVVGTGVSPSRGQKVTVHYTGRLENGTPFDSSVGKAPMEFRLGKDPMIKGFEEGVMTMKVGGKRQIILPPDLGYGSKGNPPVIPPNATLMFDLELLGVK